MFGIGIMAGGFILKIAVIKVIAPRFEETSAKIKEKMVRSTEVSACARLPARGGCMLPLVPELALLVMTQVGVRRGDVAKSLYYVCGGMRHQVPQLLVEQGSSKPSNHNGHNYKENCYKNAGAAMTVLQIFSSPGGSRSAQLSMDSRTSGVAYCSSSGTK